MIKFKIGDIVECIDNTGAGEFLSTGGIYKIDQITAMGDVAINNSSWHPRRFRRVFPDSIMKDKTLDDGFDEPDSVHWTEAVAHPKMPTVVHNYSDTKFEYSNHGKFWQECPQVTEHPDFIHVKYKYPDTKTIQPPKKSAEQLAIDVLYNTTGKLYTEREIIAVVSIVNSIKELENV